MASKSVNDILARSRVIATGMGGDANFSQLVDSRPALRALLNTALSDVYKRRARDQKNWRDVTTRQTVSMTSGVGTLPAGVLREFLHQAEFATDDTKNISYLKHELDNQQLYTQLGYAFIRGDSIHYTPADGASAFTGDLYITVPSIPSIPGDDDTAIAITDEIFEDVCFTLATLVRAGEPYRGQPLDE